MIKCHFTKEYDNMKTIVSKQKIFNFAKSFFTYFIMFIIIYTAVNWWRQPKIPLDNNLQFHSITGEKLDIYQLSQDKPLLIYFWGTWCGVCRQTSPSVAKLTKNSNYQVVSIAVQSGENSEIIDYMNNKNLDFLTVNDKDGEIFQAWQGKVTPSYVILEQGEITQGFTGIQPAFLLKLRLTIANVF